MAGVMDLSPMFLSLRVAGVATLLAAIIGLPLAYFLAQGRFPGRDWLDAFVTLPVILPPTVLGYYLLVVLGRNSPLGQAYEALFGTSLVFTWQAAVVAASIVSIPLLIKSARSAIEGVDPILLQAGRTLGLSEGEILWKIILPLAWRGILAGLVLAFARALGDFGTTLMVAGNIPGRTQTMPLAIYDLLQAGETVKLNLFVFLYSILAILILVILTKFLQGMRL